MQNILYPIILLLCARNVINFFQHREEREEESLYNMDDTAPQPSMMFRFVGNHHCAKKAKRKNQQREGDVLTLLLLLLSAIILSSAFLQLNSHLSKRRMDFVHFSSYMGDLKMELLKKLLQPILDGKTRTCSDYALKSSIFEWKLPAFLKRHRHFENETSILFPAHDLQRYFEEVGGNSQAECGSLNVMRHEWARYASYKTFPEDSPAMPSKLAAAGFHHIRPSDRVQCFSCKLIYSDWKKEDIPLDVHRRLSPNCKFILDDGDGNLSIHEENRQNRNICHGNGAQTHAHAYGRVAENSNTDSDSSANMNSNGACFETNDYVSDDQLVQDADENDFIANCKHSQYKEFDVRLSSFSKWPCGDIQEPRCLAEAGFFYAGFSDCVRCFCCGLGLRNWEYGDGAWSEHARWSADCTYLRRNNDSHNIDQHHEEDNDRSPSPSNTTSSPSETTCYSSALEPSRGVNNSHDSNRKEMLNERILSAASEMTTIHQVLEMGFDRKIVEDALQACNGDADERGEPITCEQLLDMVLSIENAHISRSDASPIPNGTETVVTSTQSRTPERFVDKVNEKASISRYDSTLSIDCLRDENRKLKDQLICKICLDKEACMILLPCGHMIACETCAPELRKCPICRKLVKERIKAFLS